MREKINRILHSRWLTLGVAPLVIALISFLELQLSVSRIPFINAEMTVVALLWNLLFCWLLLVLLMVAINRAHVAMLVGSIVSFCLAIANYYVLLFHGAPLTLPLLKNTATALDVLDTYRFTLDKYSGMILVGFVVALGVVALLWKPNRGKAVLTNKRRVWVALCGVALFALNLYLGIFSGVAFKPKSSIQFSWASSAGKYGFIAMQMESHFQENPFTLTLEGYSEEEVLTAYDEIVAAKPQTPSATQQPDIILILNESFYDLEQVVDLDTNVDPLAHYYRLDNAIKGYAVGSGEGGGTNRSEYELLTSVSTSLMPNQTPFLTLNLDNHASVVSLLEQQGYETYGAHCARSANYNRSYGYPALGFDHVYFDRDFEDLQSYGNRANTDASAYKDLIRWYETPTDKPKFMYLLTYQNHGGWEQNPAQLDTVQVQNDLGIYTDQTNEYLSSLRLSDEALVDLLAYFETVDRPVVVCMLGDHGPSFAKNIADPSIAEEDLTYRIKSTPMVMWSNYGLANEDIGYISLNYVVPKLLQTAGVSLSPFYQYQAELMERVPVVLSRNVFYNADMQMLTYTDGNPLSQDVQNYFNMCYGHIKHDSFRFMFEPME